MNRPFMWNVDLAGTLSADDAWEFMMPVGAILYHVSAVASNDSDATLKIGNSSDDDAYMVASTIGDSGTPAEKDRDDFVDDQYPHIAAGTNVVITLDHDGASGTAAQNVQIVITFLAD